MPVVVGLAKEEFEAWLISDSAAVSCIGPIARTVASPENLARREVKQLLSSWIAAADAAGREKQIRRQIASRCDLDAVQRRCRSFEKFAKELDGVASSVLRRLD